MKAVVIVVSDRVFGGEREDSASPVALEMLADHGVDVLAVECVPEGADGVSREIDRAVDKGVQIILTAGGTGVGARNLTPEVTRARLEVELTGLEQQVLIEGLKSSPKAGLARGAIGLTSRAEGAVLIANAPSSAGGVKDLLAVLGPLLPSIFERF